MLKVCLVFDCEKFISFKQGNPRWNWFERFKGKINNLIKNFRYNEKGFDLVYNMIIRERFPATFMLVGSLYKPREKKKFIEYGYHTLNHLPLILINDQKLEEEIKNIFRVKSITAPMWMIEDINNPGRILKLLKKEGYTHCVYRGENNGIEHFHYNAIKKPLNKEGITYVHVSNWFEGNWNKKKIKEIKTDIIKNLNKEGVYLLTTHDFTHKNNKNLLSIVSFLKKLGRENKIKLLRLKEVK